MLKVSVLLKKRNPRALSEGSDTRVPKENLRSSGKK
jgi:hypothetical protein